MEVRHKIVSNVPDEVCLVCAQQYQGGCRAFSVPHTDEEFKSRNTGYGMECDSASVKLIRGKEYGIKYRT